MKLWGYFVGWRFWAAVLALLSLNQVLLQVAHVPTLVVLLITLVVGGWLGKRVAEAEWEEYVERMERRRTEVMARFEDAYKLMGYRPLSELKKEADDAD